MGAGEEQSHELLVQSILDYAIFMVDPHGQVLTWNAGAEQIHGYPAQAIVGRSFELLYTEEDRHFGRPALTLRTAAATGRFQEEALRLRQDGRRFWAYAVADAIRDGQGALLGYAMVTRDITERRLTEQRLREAERRFRLFVDGVVDCAICMLDPRGVVTDWNAGAERIKGYSAAEIIGQPMAQFFIDPAAAHTALAVARSSGRYEVEEWQLRKDGSRFLAEITIDAIHDSDGSLLGFAKITRDITARKEAERRLEETRAQLFQSQKIEALGQLTGGIAHDFNNLLQGIMGALEVVQLRLGRDDGHKEDVLHFLGSAVESTRRAATLTHRLLAFARRQPLAPKAVNLNLMVQSMAELLTRTLGEHIELKLALTEGLLPVLCDPNQLESAILNLAINARDAMPHGGVLTIRTCQAPPADETANGRHPPHSVCLQVADSGAGMTPEVRERAFDPFFTTKPKGRGTGLGLSMIHGFVTQSHGSIALDSQPGNGTTVSICLPCSERRTVRVREECATTYWLPTAAGESILLVEDEDVVRDVVAGKLRELNYRVLEARDGHTGLALLESDERVDLVIADIGLPGLNGLRMVEVGRHRRPDLRVLLMTGYGETMSAEGLAETGMELLPKPFEFDLLIARIRQLLPPALPAIS